ncbi:Imm52 family immunity protein [Burkholderia gladioli]|uniref:Imm52 family immunity protein n=1 Tax=Burkholderia gladioli TaxID=28095 RepID=UPI00163E6089|nr:Imm52 family immunity protein [Burkholderia gladioli]
MKLECTIKRGGIPPTDFFMLLNKVGAVIDVIATSEPQLSRSSWRMKGYSLEAAQSRGVYEADGTPCSTAIETLRRERADESIASLAIWGGQVNQEFGASIEVLACGGDFPDTVTIEVRGAFVDAKKDAVVAIVTRAALEFMPTAISATPKGYEEQQAFDDRPGAGWMLYLPVELTEQQIPEAQELIPVLSPDGEWRLGTIIVSVDDEPFSVDNEAHLMAAHDIEVRLISMDLLPRFTDI